MLWNCSLSFSNPLKTGQKRQLQQFATKAPISRRVLLIRGSHRLIWSKLWLPFHTAVNILLSHIHTLSPLCSRRLFDLSSLFSSVNWVFISHIRSTAAGARLSSSVRGRNWRWLYRWSAPWILSTCSKNEWQQLTSVQEAKLRWESHREMKLSAYAYVFCNLLCSVHTILTHLLSLSVLKYAFPINNLS